ncbi:hypothetical protein ACPSM1_14210 [Micromonospora chersina]|uniref:hypothetical protein n=1 Tax=Micromonospora chersina TaxID=47854 RepID=UPI003CB2961D
MNAEERTSPRQIGLSIEVTDAVRGLLLLKLGTSRFECILVPDYGGPATGHPGPTFTLEQWLIELRQLRAGADRVLLPFNFSDQCTGWLRVAPSREGLFEVQAGWSELGQYDIDLSEFMVVGRSLADFEPVPNARIERPLDEIVGAVAAIRDALARCLPPAAR